jgi:DNA-binding NarL/FixJ family response regulator
VGVHCSTRSQRSAYSTEQERRILELIGEGLTNRQIGERLHLAEKTVKNYVSSLLAKLGMERRTQAAAFVARLDAEHDHQNHQSHQSHQNHQNDGHSHP